MGENAAVALAWPLRVPLVWNKKTLAMLRVRRATFDAAERGRESFRATGFLIVTPDNAPVLTRLGVQWINVRAEYYGDMRYVWTCERAMDQLRVSNWPGVVWIA